MIRKLPLSIPIMSLSFAINVAWAQPSLDDGLRAIHKNDSITLQNLIDQGLDVNERGYFGATLLATAVVQSNNVEIIRVLMQAGADTSVFDEYTGESVFQLALGKKSPEVRYAMIRWLLFHEKDPVKYSGKVLGVTHRVYQMPTKPKPEYKQWFHQAMNAKDAEAVRLILTLTYFYPAVRYCSPLNVEEELEVRARQDGNETIVELIRHEKTDYVVKKIKIGKFGDEYDTTGKWKTRPVVIERFTTNVPGDER